MFLTGDNNFRYNIFAEYKSHRAPSPRHREKVKEYVARNWNATVSDGCEADDLLGVAQCTADINTTCICSIDKDLNCIPGEHYHPGIKRKQVWIKEPHFYSLSEIEALRFFYTQMLTGDATDGVKGVKGIGPKGAEKMLKACSSEQEMFNVVRDAYSCDEEMLMNGKCLWIWRKMNGTWEFPFTE